MTETYQLDSKLGIDSDDRKIMALLQENPDLTHVEIAQQVHKSQPAVGARILKLERKGLLSMQYGIDLSANKFVILLVSMHAKFPQELLDILNDCPFVVQAFKTTGQRNISVWMVGMNLDRLETIVERHFRSNQDITYLDISVAIEPINKFIMPLNFAFEGNSSLICSDVCHNRILELIAKGEDYKPVIGESAINKKFKINDDDKRINIRLC